MGIEIFVNPVPADEIANLADRDLFHTYTDPGDCEGYLPIDDITACLSLNLGRGWKVLASFLSAECRRVDPKSVMKHDWRSAGAWAVYGAHSLTELHPVTEADQHSGKPWPAKLLEYRYSRPEEVAVAAAFMASFDLADAWTEELLAEIMESDVYFSAALEEDWAYDQFETLVNNLRRYLAFLAEEGTATLHKYMV